jgi:hypothetical protein
MSQASLFDSLSPDSVSLTAGLAGVMPNIRAAMLRVCKEYPEGRKSLPDAISEVAQREGIALTSKGGKAISLEVLNKWLQPNASEHEPGIRAILAFCHATQNFSPLDPILKACGLAVIPAAKLPLLALGEACALEDKAKAAKRKAKALL